MVPSAGSGSKWPKSVRMAFSREFQKVRQQGKTVHSLHLRISYLKESSGIRIGLVTSRRVGGAVERNRIRRQLREIFRRLLPQLSSGSLVITVKPGASSTPFSILQEECLLLIHRLSIFPPLQ